MKSLHRMIFPMLTILLIFSLPAGLEVKASSSRTNQPVLISNESTDGNKSENSGSFQVNNDDYTFNKRMSKDAYQLDYVKPFNSEPNGNRILLNKVYRTEKSRTGESKSFWVTNLMTNKDNKLPAELEYSGSHVNVWVNNHLITWQEAGALGREFDSRIYPLDVDHFGHPPDVDGSGKINILCYDIQDGFTRNGGYVAGYFAPRDLSNVPHSNRTQIFYLDTYPTMGMGSIKDVSETYSTLAHEFQHMINFNQNVLVEGHPDMDAWLNEGLSMAAEQIYSGKVLQDRIEYYNYDTSIANGQSLLYWDDSGDNLANYSLSYLFLQYLKIQSNQGNAIFKELINDPNSDYRAVQDLIHKYISPDLSFGKFMTDFRAALYLNKRTGIFGFQGDPGFASIKKRIFSGSSVGLRGGGAVVRELPTDTIPGGKGNDITYTLLAKLDTVSPQPPKVHPAGDSDRHISGTAEASAMITVQKGSQILARGKTGSHRVFNVGIPKQKAGTILTVFARDAAGNRSNASSVTVKDKTAPSRPAVSPFSNNQTKLSGRAEAGSSITVKHGRTIVGAAKTGKNGRFTVNLKRKQKAGTILTIYARDRVGNQSAGKSLKVADRIPPAVPSVRSVSERSTHVTGRTEHGARVYLYHWGRYLGSTKAGSTGYFSIKTYRHKRGTVLNLYAQDEAGNKSRKKYVKVI
ncbi:hypothetical protein EWI07_12985 [Sporolactobacillus sp. THM7-4]|nr:hypothetical protein EWI07_12985 [Sporolactobacillus sp. THM7-4]